MGVLCDVYIADQERAMKYSFRGKCKCKSWKTCKCWDEYDPKTYDCIESRRIYTDDFAQLLSILRGKMHNQSAVKEFEMVEQFSDMGPWIQKVPDDLARLLAAATSEELRSITEKWIKTMKMLGPKRSENISLILDYLKLLQDLSEKSIKKEQKMYLWTCL